MRLSSHGSAPRRAATFLLMVNRGVFRRCGVVSFWLLCWLRPGAVAGPVSPGARASDPLPSWNDVKTKLAILCFVATATRRGSRGFVPPAERIATFDNDGTLWAEQPMY